MSFVVLDDENAPAALLLFSHHAGIVDKTKPVRREG